MTALAAELGSTLIPWLPYRDQKSPRLQPLAAVHEKQSMHHVWNREAAWGAGEASFPGAYCSCAPGNILTLLADFVWVTGMHWGLEGCSREAAAGACIWSRSHRPQSPPRSLS